ncbi:hypothetical protein CYLTODRAFT_427270 [Cylindrobasidium torrendii FP15055 ss-10]|uniref:P-loop containing nucleoside triphosphate hydrolase protein n=1 Tax=Cylindrobasidium torrendii FP15055 ss-10 TaxID=1314674 RepID=A0A0D7AVN8_9AGAR|nr:hypothetical protein CYLTODRAFT_427270 [Cylindrobasidium torrendii FP15055 ss-10]
MSSMFRSVGRRNTRNNAYGNPNGMASTATLSLEPAAPATTNVGTAPIPVFQPQPQHVPSAHAQPSQPPPAPPPQTALPPQPTTLPQVIYSPPQNHTVVPNGHVANGNGANHHKTPSNGSANHSPSGSARNGVVGDHSTPRPDPFANARRPVTPFHEPDDDTTGAIDSSEYAQRCREIMGLYNKLLDLGAGTFLEQSIPKVVVIGGQSAGKSSLVEAVSKINVPRDSGTCTRCPMQCTLATPRHPYNGPPWSCQIDLRYEHNADGTAREAVKSVPFATLTDKRDVELNLRRAQLAILNERSDPEQFRRMSADELKQFADIAARKSQGRSSPTEALEPRAAAFSKNMVVLKIISPDTTDLTFVDLPGLVTNATDSHLPEEITKLKIKNEKTIVLITIPMGEDIERHESVKYAREVDPNGDRTIGVLTKPDTLSAGASGQREKWRKVLLGQDEQAYLKHGYFCVRLPDDEARKRNTPLNVLNQYFNSTAPWSDLPKHVKDRYGVDPLVSYVSKLLVDMFEKSIPEMRRHTDKLLQDAETRLNDLGSGPDLDNALTTLAVLVAHFSWDLRETVSATGAKERKRMYQENSKHYGDLKTAILRTYPKFPFSGPTSTTEEDVQMSKSSYELDLNAVRRCIKECVCWLLFLSLEAFVYAFVWRLSLGRVCEESSRLTVVLRRNTGKLLPDQVPLEATTELIRGFTQKWAAPTQTCFNRVFSNSLASVQRLAKAHFGQTKRLEEHVRSVIDKEMKLLKVEALVIMQKVIELETHIATMNPQYASERDNWQQASRGQRVYLNGLHYPTTSSEAELGVMGQVHGYFQVAYKRYIDTVAATMESELIGKMTERLTKALMMSVSVAGKARDLLREDESKTQERHALTARCEKLNEIKDKLDGFDVADGDYEDLFESPVSLSAPSMTAESSMYED